jgi:hypothetical protein
MTLLARFLVARRAWLAELDAYFRRRLAARYPGIPVKHLGRRALWLAFFDSVRPSREAVEAWNRAVEEDERARRGER